MVRGGVAVWRTESERKCGRLSEEGNCRGAEWEMMRKAEMVV